jgi:hypothetical protein
MIGVLRLLFPDPVFVIDRVVFIDRVFFDDPNFFIDRVAFIDRVFFDDPIFFIDWVFFGDWVCPGSKASIEDSLPRRHHPRCCKEGAPLNPGGIAALMSETLRPTNSCKTKRYSKRSALNTWTAYVTGIEVNNS